MLKTQATTGRPNAEGTEGSVAKLNQRIKLSKRRRVHEWLNLWISGFPITSGLPGVLQGPPKGVTEMLGRTGLEALHLTYSIQLP